MVHSTGHIHEDLDKKVCLECHRQFTGIVAACPHDNSMLVPVAQDPLIGTKLAGKYEILSVLGTGGMGVVYKGRQDVMDRIVAIKMLQSHHLADSMSVKRFQQEGKATCKLNHPHIITVYDFGISSQSGQPYIVMDYLQGVPMSEIIKQEGQVSVDRALKIFMQASEALGHAHKQGVIHRDLKPSNIVLINYDGDKDFVKVVDFGVAQIMEDVNPDGQRLTQMGEVCGSPVYMSPEQCQGHALDNRSDIYSMGVVMYETLTNRLPLLGRTMVETMRKHIEEDPPPFTEVRPDLYIPERVEQVILKAMAKDPAHRHQSMEQLAADLELAVPRPGRSQVLRTAPLETETTAPAPTEALNTLFMRMTLTQWALVLVVTVTLGALTIVGLYTMLSAKSKAKQAPPPAVTQVEPAPVHSLDVPTKKAADVPATPDKTTATTEPANTTATPGWNPKKQGSETPAEGTTGSSTETAKTQLPPANTTPSTTPDRHSKKSVASATPKRQKKAASQAVSAAPKPAKKDNVWGDLIKQRSYRTGHSLEN